VLGFKIKNEFATYSNFSNLRLVKDVKKEREKERERKRERESKRERKGHL